MNISLEELWCDFTNEEMKKGKVKFSDFERKCFMRGAKKILEKLNDHENYLLQCMIDGQQKIETKLKELQKNFLMYSYSSEQKPTVAGEYLVRRKLYNKTRFQILGFDGEFWITSINDDPNDEIISWISLDVFTPVAYISEKERT